VSGLAPASAENQEATPGNSLRQAGGRNRSSADAPANWLGSMKRRIEIVGDIVSPANEENEWKALRD
jgi:hypothetical protein